MPFPISVNVGDGSPAVVAVSSAAIVLVLALRPIIKKAKAQDLRFFAGCALAGALAVLLTGAVCTVAGGPSRDGRDAQEGARPSGKQPTDASGIVGVAGSLLSSLDQLSARDCRALKDEAAISVGAPRPRLKEALELCEKILALGFPPSSRS